MGQYDDFTPKATTAASLWRELTDLLVGNHSVEVLPNGSSVLFRVWYERGEGDAPQSSALDLGTPKPPTARAGRKKGAGRGRRHT